MKLDSHVRVLAWNVMHAGNTPERLDRVTEVIDQYQPDVVYLSELARHGGEDDTSRRTKRIIGQLGECGLRTPRIIPYGDQKNIHYMTMAVADNVTEEPRAVQLGDRKGCQVQTNVGLILGMHADDRYEHLRRASLRAAISNQPQVIMGDLNSIDPEAPRTQPLRILSHMNSFLGLDAIDLYTRTSKVNRMLGIAVRLSGMATSEVIPKAQEHFYFTADELHSPTVGHERWGYAVDHVLVLKGLIAIPRITPFDSVSDHKPVVADIYKPA